MYINNPGHMTKMDAMAIYGKTVQKSSSLELVVLFVLCLGVLNIFVLLAPYVCFHIFS